MWKMVLWQLLFVACFNFGLSCNNNDEAKGTQNLKGKSDSINSFGSGIPEKLQKLIVSYPEFLDSADQNNIYWKDGTVMVYDDGIKEKTHDQKLDNPDVEDMLSQDYVAGEGWDFPPAENYEPGRIRFEPFFLKMYGNNPSEVESNLEDVRWVDGSTLKFNRINGAADSLKKVIEDLKKLPHEFRKYLDNPAGTFVWRNIAGTERLSNHSFATAIDINTRFSDYWLWSKNKVYKNRIPFEIVTVFEKHGFIWGGKWYHYDTMHFEFRPELIN